MTATLVSRSYSFEVINHNTGDIYDLVVSLPRGVKRNDALRKQIEAKVQVLADRIFAHEKTASQQGTFEGAEEISCDLLANNNFFNVEGKITSQKVCAFVQKGDLFESLSELKGILSQTSASSSSTDERTSNRAATTTPPRSTLGKLFGGRQTRTTSQNSKRFVITWNSLFGAPLLKTTSHKNPSLDEVIKNAYKRTNTDYSDVDTDEESYTVLELEHSYCDLDLTPSHSPTGNLTSFSNLNSITQSSSNGGRALPSHSEELMHDLTYIQGSGDEEDNEAAAIKLKIRTKSNISQNSSSSLRSPSPDSVTFLQQFNVNFDEILSQRTYPLEDFPDELLSQPTYPHEDFPLEASMSYNDQLLPTLGG